MNICLITAVSNPGCTAHIREAFVAQLNVLIPGARIRQFILPKDGPTYCLGCKACFFKDMSACPHLKATLPIWQAMEEACLVVFITPTYVFSIPGQLKALLDHFGSRWIVHQPSPKMLGKQALIINQAVGAGFRSTLIPLKHSLRFWGIKRIYHIKARLGMTDYDLVDQKAKAKLEPADRENNPQNYVKTTGCFSRPFCKAAIPGHGFWSKRNSQNAAKEGPACYQRLPVLAKRRMAGRSFPLERQGLSRRYTR